VTFLPAPPTLPRISDVVSTVIGQAVTAGLNTLSGLFTIIPQGVIDTIPIQATLSERYTDRLEVTKHPVQLGAQISDHTYRLMPVISLRCGWSNSRYSGNPLVPPSSNVTPATFAGGQMSVGDYVSGIYSQLLALQQSNTRFDVISTLRHYTSMVITSLEILERDQKTSQALMITVTCEQLLVVNTTTAQLPPITNQANPLATATTQNTGSQSLGAPVTPSSIGSVPQTTWTAPTDRSS